MRLLADLDEPGLLALAAAVAQSCSAGDVICLSGTLGAGKTAFARGMLHGLGLPIEADVPSPTFTLVNSYAPPDVRMPVAHIDLYRLEDAQQIKGLGLEDLMDDHLLIVEWPERWGEDHPADALQIHIQGVGTARTIRLDGPVDRLVSRI